MSASPRVVLIDYGSGNLRSASKAFAHVGNALNAQITITNNADDLKNATHIVLPGVGAFADCMRGLQAVPGMIDAMQEHVLQQKKWFLGICVGMQLLFETGHEHGIHKGLGWLAGEVVGIRHEALGMRENKNPQSPIPHPVKIPHMGWNDLTICAEHPLLAGIKTGDHAYFVHSYCAKLSQPNQLLATSHHGVDFPAIVGYENVFGTQFHPEKSQRTGLQLIENFLKFEV